MAAMGNMSALRVYLCHPNVTLEWLNITANTNLSIQQLQQQLCSIDYNLLWEKIKVYINYDKIIPHFVQVTTTLYFILSHLTNIWLNSGYLAPCVTYH